MVARRLCHDRLAPIPVTGGHLQLGQLQFNDGSSRVIQSEPRPGPRHRTRCLSSGGQHSSHRDRRSAVEMGRKAALAVKPRISKIEERSLNTIAERILSSGEKTRTPREPSLPDSFRGRISPRGTHGTPSWNSRDRLPRREDQGSRRNPYPRSRRKPSCQNSHHQQLRAFRIRTRTLSYHVSSRYKQFCGRAGRPIRQVRRVGF